MEGRHHKARDGQTKPFMIHMEHGHIHQNQQKSDGNAKSPFHGSCILLQLSVQSILAVLSFSCAACSTLMGSAFMGVSLFFHQLCTVSGLYHCCYNICLSQTLFIIYYIHGFCKQIDACLSHSVKLAYRLLHMGGAGRTGHTCNMIPFLHHLAFFHFNFLISSTASSTIWVLPFLTSSTTQVSICSFKITYPKACSALCTAATCVRISPQ